MNFSESHSISAEGQSRENDNTSNVSERERNTFLCLSWTGGKLGGACYDSETCVFRIFNDKPETSPDFYVTKILCQQIEPTNVIISSKEAIGDWIKMLKNDIGKDNAFEAGKNRLEMIHFPQMPNTLTSKTERTMFFSSYFNYENINAVKCYYPLIKIQAAGALLKNLDKMRINIQLEEDTVMVPILAIDTINLEELVFIDTRTYRVLQIFHQLNHPSAYKSSRKEGLSLFSILNHCRTSMGSKEMRKYFLRPTKDKEILENRLNAIEYFNRVQSLEITSSLENHVKDLSDVLRILKRMRGSLITIKEWETLYKTMYSATIIVDIASHLPRNIAIFRKINEKRTPDLCRIATIIQKTVDFEGGVKPNTFCVKQGIEDELDEKKRLYYGLPDLMDIIAEQELQNLDDEFGMCSVMYLPRLGYMVAVNETPKLIENNRQIPNFQYTFSNDGVSHYKTAKTMELDRQLGDMHYVIRDRENVILEGLQTLILGLSQTIYDAIACCAELDCLLAFASVAREYCYTRPKIMSEPSLKIIKSRHPLQEHCVSSFVENDIIAGGNNPTKITILTGPNASGKSVYLKQIALLVFMAHIGSYVPAQSAEIGLVDGIFTQIRLIESVTNPLSAFMLDLNQIALGIRISTSNSLTIIDEFGQGTDESDGLALLASIVNYWIRNQFLTPLTFVSTHFHSLKNLLERSNIVKYKTMEVYIHGGEEAFLYNLVDGVADGSYAHKIAEKAGIPKEMIQRGLEMSEILSDPKSIPEPILTSESYKEKMKECDDICAALLDFDPKTRDLTGLYRACKIDLPAIAPLPETTNQEESSSPKPRNTRQTEEDLESSSLP